MSTQKIYLTNHEIENLCFLKFVLIPMKRLEIRRAQGSYNYAIKLDAKHILPKPDLVILFSSVEQIEIPDIELSLLKHQFKIPIGLLSTVQRKVKDTPKKQQSQLDDLGDTGKIEWQKDKLSVQYVSIRRSLIQLLLYGYKNTTYQESIEVFVNNFNALSGFPRNLIEVITDQKQYPKLVVKGSLNSAEFFMYTWWGKFIIDQVLEPQKDQIEPGVYTGHKRWFKNFDLNDVSRNCTNIQTIPKLYEEYLPVIFGYFFAFMAIDDTGGNVIGESIKECLSDVRDKDLKKEVLLWGIFFQNLFVEEVDYIFANPLVKRDFLTMESIAYNFSRYIHNEGLEFTCNDFKYSNVNSDQLVEKYFEIAEGKKGKKPINLHENDLRIPFEKSPLFMRNENNVFLVNEAINWNNKLITNGSKFSLTGSLGLNEKAVFYGDISKEDKKQLEKIGLKFKLKSLSSIIPQSKKTLVGFVAENQSNDLWELYTYLVKNKRVTKIEEAVLVWLISDTDARIKSTEFALEKNNMADELASRFGVNVTLIVKNIHDTNDVEVKHNLKVALKGQTLKTHIEVIDVNLEQRSLEWLINATDEYYVKTDGLDYHFFSNS